MEVQSLDRSSGVPIYLQIRRDIRRQISEGHLNHGEKLPSESSLAKQYGVSRMTIRKALNGLLEEGVLFRRHGVGTFVSRLPVTADYTKLTSFSQEALSQGKTPTAELLSLTMKPATSKLAETLALAPDEAIICLERLRKVERKPVGIQQSHVPESLCPPDIQEQDWTRQSLFALLESHGIHMARAIETIGVSVADTEQAKLLNLDPGVPLLYIERTTFGEDDKPVEFVKMWNRPDRYECTIFLHRHVD